MTTDVQRLLETFVEMREQANVNACFGEPVKVDTRTIVPVANVGYGFGVGATGRPTSDTEGPEEGVAGPFGGGMKSTPLGVIEVTEDAACFQPVIDEQKVAMATLFVAAWSVFWLARVLLAVFGRKE